MDVWLMTDPMMSALPPKADILGRAALDYFKARTIKPLRKPRTRVLASKRVATPIESGR